ncbi:MAG: esterase-like activity of phytase family protein [Cyanobacteria bacterium J06639_16]
MVMTSGLPHRGWSRWLLGGVLTLALLLSSCTLPQVSAEERLFLHLSLDLVGTYTLPKQTFEETPVGGISAIAYDAERDRVYALSDDRGRIAPSRFYTLRLGETSNALDEMTIESVTLLRDAGGELFPVDSLDPEGMALSPRNTLMISSEGVGVSGSPPRLMEFDRDTGQLMTEFRLPDRYLPSSDPSNPEGGITQGVQDNLSLEALTVSGVPSRGTWVEPFRLFVATEGPLRQDLDEDFAIAPKNRLLHYLIGQDQSTLISEHIYPLEIAPTGAVVNGLSELLSLDQAGHFLGLERAFGFKGFEIKLYQLATGGATDSSTLVSAKGELNGITPIQKQLVLDLADLDIPLDNFEAMTLGVPVDNGNQSLLLASDDNFDDAQTTEFLLFKLQLTP